MEWLAAGSQCRRTITTTYDPLHGLTGAVYSTGESFAYTYDAVGNRTAATETTPLSGTLVTTYTYDAASRLAARSVSDGRAYTYTWSARGQLLAEWTQGYPVRTFTYDGAGRLVEATVFTLTTRFTYNGLGDRVAVEVVGLGTTTYTLDLAAGGRILAEETLTETTLYLYGLNCLGQYDPIDDGWLYYLPDAEGLVRQGANADGDVTSAWLFDPSGTVLEGPQGPMSHLVCGGVYDWSTGLIYKGGRYFDPLLGIWLALLPLVVVQSWRGRKGKRRGFPWYVFLLLMVVGMSGMMLTGCTEPPQGPTWEEVGESVCTEVPEGFELPPQIESRTSHPVRIVDYSGPGTTVTSQDEDSYLYYFSWRVNFEVEREPGTGSEGWVIQQIESWREEEGRNGSAEPYHKVYWEAWRVAAGSIEAKCEPDSPVQAYDDDFWVRPSGTNGWNETRGIVKFYEGDRPSHFVRSNPNIPEAGDLYASETPPAYWDYSGTIHRMKMEWTGFRVGDNKPCWSYEARRGNLGTSDSWCGSW